jgi:hypothetical protein
VLMKLYDHLDLSLANLDNVLTVRPNRDAALYVAQERGLPRSALTLAHTDRGFWVYVFQLSADIRLGTITLAGAQPGTENVVTLSVHDPNRDTAQGVSLAEVVALLVALGEY